MADKSMDRIMKGVDTAAKKIAPPLSEADQMANNQREARKEATREKIMSTGLNPKEHPKGPQHRVQELQRARAKTVAEKKSGAAKKAGYDPDARLQSIDHEIKRLSR